MASSSASTPDQAKQANFFAELMKASRKKLLDLSLRNKLINFPPVGPDHKDDGRAHKYLKVGGQLKAVWDRLVDDEKQLKIFRFNPAELEESLRKLNDALRKTSARSEADLIRQRIKETTEEIAEGKAMAVEGHVWVDKLGDEAYQKRLRRLRDEAKSLEDTTGDSAFFLAFGFLKWPEKPKSSRVAIDPTQDGISTARCAPLILVKISLTDEGKGTPGRRKFRIVPEDDPTDNQSLKAKLYEDWEFTIPDLQENAKASDYFAAVRRAITLSKLEGFEVLETLALGFFNFARYRLWLDLDPKQWGGASPEAHPIVKSILSVEPLDTTCPRVIDATRDDAIADEVARHQETEDIPIVRDSDTSQYSALLYARKGKSLVVIGPPGSGKSQTITNLVATSIAAGKRVLFVAQKLPALDVVARRIREAGLGEFCLQFYSAKQDGEPNRKPVSPIQIHSQLTAARHLLGGRPRYTAADRRAPGLAKKLNGYSSTVHGIHPIFGESIQRLLCTALKLKEEAMQAWAENWDDALLVVTLPEGAPSTDWIEARSRLLGEIARLRHESGDFWRGWIPTSLTVLDIPTVEAAFEHHRRNLNRVCDWCLVIAPSLVDWDQSFIHSLAEASDVLTIPHNCSDEFVRVISSSDDLMRLAHELERELTEAEAASKSGTELLELLPEGANATALFAFNHLGVIERCIEPSASFGDAASSLERLNGLLRITDVLLQSIPLHADGLVAYAGSEKSAKVTVPLVVAVAQLEEGKFRRAPTQLLPALARSLVGQPSLADDAMVVADRVDDLVAKKNAASSIFSQTIRAEKFANEAFVAQLELACNSGIGQMPVLATAPVDDCCQSVARAAHQLLAANGSALAAAADADGAISNARSAELRFASETIQAKELIAPTECDPRLVQAWANGAISESDARAAASAHEKAGAITKVLGSLLGNTPPTAGTCSLLETSIAAAETLGLAKASLAEIAALTSQLDQVERTVAAMLPVIRRFGSPHQFTDFVSVANASRLASLIAPLPNLRGAVPTKLADKTVIADLAKNVTRARSTRHNAIPGAFKTLSGAANLIRSCIQAANVAEQIASGIAGIRRPTTLRELRSIGAATPVLRAIPALPIGCDFVQMSGEQYAATIRHVVELANQLHERVKALPTGADHNSVPTSSEARKKLEIFREKQTSPFRFLNGEWRAARSTIKRFAPNLPIQEGLAAYETACAIKADEESFADDASGKAAIGSYFRGLKTDWKPFVNFADWVEKLTLALDGFERNERVVEVWRSENSAINSVASACAQFEAAATECRAACPDLFGGADGPFQPDALVGIAKERASTILSLIDSLIASPLLALSEGRDSVPTTQPSVTEVVEVAAEAERELSSRTIAARATLGETFHGRPDNWTHADSIIAWANKLHSAPELTDARAEIFATCVATPEMVEKFIADAEVLEASLRSIRQTLSQSRVRPDETASVTSFFATIRETLRKISVGSAALAGLPTESIETMREASKLIADLLFEMSRSERLRNAVAPKLPTTSSVETTLNWALSLEARKLPKQIVALVADVPERVPDVSTLLTLAAAYNKQIEAIRALGCSFAPWTLVNATVQEAGVCSSTIAAGLTAARKGAIDGGAKSDCTVTEMLDATDAVRGYLRLQAQGPDWTAKLGCDPFSAEDPGSAIRETVFWVESLHTDRIPVAVMSWIVVAQADHRLHWWASLVRNSKAWRAQRTTLRQSSLPEFDESTELATWRRELSSRQTALALAIDQLARTVKRPETSLAKLRGAAEKLKNSADAANRAASIRDKTPGSLSLKSAHEVASNRDYAAWIADQPAEVASWALKTSAHEACTHLNGLQKLLNDEMSSWQSLAETFATFGTCEKDGPSGILSEDQPLADATRGIELGISNLHGLSAWASLQRETKRAAKLGVDRIATEILEKEATPDEAMAAFRAGVAWQKALVVWKENPNLERFRSAQHEELRTEFAKEDLAAVKNQNRQRIIFSLHEKTGGGMASWGNGYTDQLLLHEASKRRKLMPVRKLVAAAGKRMQELCPCWLATPAAIAQFMAPGMTDFDLIIMDEASQLTPEDSWGAIARGRQAVIVGDPKQMPPSSFFEQAATEDDDEVEPKNEEPTEKAQGPVLKGHQQESVLLAAEACLPHVWLNWHYRSLHESLIAPANVLSYDRRLVLFPSSHINHGHLGVRHTYIQDGTATTGQVKNANEASAVVNQLVQIAEEFAQPAHCKLAKAPHSVGIIAMNIHQQETIKDLIDAKRAQDPFFDRNLAFLEAHETEPFFVRNLENVQGDERDVIIISTTYGPNTPGGTPTQRFFPINQEGGERRFNVLITRAKWRMEVFSSLRSTQLTSAQLGVQHMRSFLEYCETGRLAVNGVHTDRWFDSPFEAHVYAVLEAKGYAVVKQVGVAGYYLDLAIKDPLTPNRYVLGIECDGATYHSSRAARDRDRLREQVLNERGWDIHRIWSTEWFYNNAAVRKGLFAAVEDALSNR